MYSNILKISKDLIGHCHNKDELSYIFKTKIHAIIVFQIFGNKRITYEDLCKNLIDVASRTTIQSILIEGVDRKYLVKEINQKDKRKKYYNCDNLKAVINEWFQRNKKIFNS